MKSAEATWYQTSAEAVITRLESDRQQGLNNQEVEQRQAQYGKNRLRKGKRKSLAYLVLHQFSDFMILVLMAAAIISGVIGDIEDTIAILFILLLNGLIGAVQAYRAERALEALRAMDTPQVSVLRDGKKRLIPAVELVPGDIVSLQEGNLVAADMRLLKAVGLESDESTLTGESQTAHKSTETIEASDLPPGDRNNMVFRGSHITRGRGTGIVTAIGMQTEIGQIANLRSVQKGVQTPLQVRMARFGRLLAIAILLICSLIFITGLLQGQPLILMLLTAISLAVAAIPEALPAVITISLALGARRLSRNNSLVRNLPAVETLGSVTYICSDKTGTLTQNRMSVETFVIAGRSFSRLDQAADLLAAQQMGKALALCNDVSRRGRELHGEPTELALYQAAEAAGYQKQVLEQRSPRQAEIPFDSKRKLMMTLHPDAEGSIAYVKGAPEVVLTRCLDQCGTHGPEALDSGHWLHQAEALANRGYRVIAVAQHRFAGSVEQLTDADQALTLLGLVALIDPPRPEAEGAVSDCRGAGITPVMITGDHPGTAKAIAVRLGIVDEQAPVLTGQEIEQLTESEFQHRVRAVRVYARVSPTQKIRIVQALQQQGEFVAMTGDGVNDAPALKQAGIGVAMGKKGTDVARQAADMVLLDDNFATIVQAVREGRRIFDNIRKFIKYTMTSNSGEIWTLFLAPFLGLPVPLLPIHILWINLVTDGLPGLAFTFEKEEPGSMLRPPRPPRESIFSHGMWQHILWVGLFIGAISIASQAWAIGQDNVYWQTIVFTVLTFSQLFHALAVRSEHRSIFSLGVFSNTAMLGAVILTFGLQMAVIYIPGLNPLFNTQPLPLSDLFICIGLSSLTLFVVECEKLLVRRRLIYNRPPNQVPEA
ncbi:MAG: calcium-translocating P-type ATPase, PMCA-type [Sedimenticola selenatireducens]|uniref:P-type Ca(2+) transporter n=2 Tax=Sedimenticola selenatireducens TaxID=191960 RepID=A0A2N6CVL3_9GAMM|nr:MAG: calcium-translocating P-type ATPase, PMCA-type [Sedimenticola selenatireducens]